MSTGAAVGLAVVIIVAMATVGYFGIVPGGQISSLQSQVNSLQSQVATLEQTAASLRSQAQLLNANVSGEHTLQQHLQLLYSNLNSSQRSQAASLQKQIQAINASLSKYSVNQSPVTRNVLLTWTKDLSQQDRFFQGPIVVNQGDMVHVTFESNDTVTHTFTLASPYNFQINASMPGLGNDLTGKKFTTPATNNSPGVVISGTPGNVTGVGSFVAKYVGIFTYVCIYHIGVGMYGFMIVLPNAAYAQATTTTTKSATTTLPAVPVSILEGSATNTKSPGYSPSVITVVIGVNNTVTWMNNDTTFHTVTAVDKSFDSGNMNPAQTFSFTFTRTGTYNYVCVYHPWMKSTVVVKGG